MKKMRRLAALFLAVVMVMAMGLTAMAADVEIKGALDNATYDAYKIFNVKTATEKDSEDNDVVVGYTYTRPIYKADKVTKNLQLETEEGYFTVTTGLNDVYYTPDKNLTGSSLAEYLANQDLDAFALEKATAASEKNVAKFTGLSDGYYYIISNQGTVAMLRAIDGKTETITEKDTTPGWGNGGKKSYSVDAQGNKTEDHFFAIGETITYEVVYENAYNFVKETDKTTKVYEYNVKDTMPKGVKLDAKSVKVAVTEKGATTPTIPEEEKAAPVITENADGTGFTIRIPWAKTNTVDPNNAATAEDFYYKNVPATIKVTYTATVTSDVNSTGTAMTNHARVSYNGNPFTPDTTLDPGDNDVYTGVLKIQKYDSSAGATEYTEETALVGAKFKIYKKVTEVVEEKKVEVEKYLDYDPTGKIIWVDEANAEEFTTDEENKGILEIKGLDLGTYYAKEIVAPAGYNLLDKPVTMVISGEVNEKGQLTTANSDLIDSKDVGNKKGAVLPSTGGIGTTIFYVVGGILVLGAGVLLITKKRMSAR